MNPSKLHHDLDVKMTGAINGDRHLPLRINKDSHGIHKPKRKPVIIYTHTPKVIHAEARDFMTLVQKLTGMPRSDDEKVAKSELDEEKSLSMDKNLGFDDNDDKLIYGGECGEIYRDSYGIPSIYNMPDPCVIDFDATLFELNMNDYHIYSSRSNYGMQNSISYPLIDGKGYHEY